MNRIVFFDSGVGGLTVLREACRTLPAESYLYYADTLNVPYGTHSKEEVCGFVAACIDDILSRCSVRAIVIACNTATSVAAEDLRKRYSFPIIGMEPAVKPALQSVREMERRVLVTATPLTLKEQKFQRLLGRLDGSGLVDMLGLPGLVRLAEEGKFDGPEAVSYLQEQFAPYELDRYGAIVLGCTHFVFFKEAIRRIIPPHILVMDGNKGTVKQVQRVLGLEEQPEREELPDIAFMSSRGTEEERNRLAACFRELL